MLRNYFLEFVRFFLEILKGPNTFKFHFKPAQLLGSQSQAGQESMAYFASGKRLSGSYLEVGAHDGFSMSNTFILETRFGWHGLSIEIDESLSLQFAKLRSNPCLAIDGITADYLSLLKQHNLPKNIDYLQIDIEPATNSLAALMAIPFREYSFGFITFEHDLDSSQDNSEIQQRARKFLISQGYLLWIENVKFNGSRFEDWFIHPSISPRIANFRIPASGLVHSGNEFFSTRSRIQCQIYNWLK